MIDIIRARRSIRSYQEKNIEPEKIEILKEALLRSPTSKNNNAWEFVFIDDKNLLKKLAECKPHGASFLRNAPLGIVICGDETLSDVWVENCSIASIVLQLAAHSMGLGSCWIQIRRRNFSEKITAEEYIQQLLNIPNHLKVESIISIGYPAERKEVKPKEMLVFDKIKYNVYPK